MQYPNLMELARSDSRYPYEAYEFLFEALRHTQERLNKPQPEKPEDAQPEHHVSGRELVDGFLDLAKQQFGRMSRTVLHLWGIDRTDDIGELVFNLIEAELLSKTDGDRKADFNGLCDLDRTLVAEYQITWED